MTLDLSLIAINQTIYRLLIFNLVVFEIENTVAINSTTADFGPSFYGGAEQVVYATARDTNSFVKRTHSWNDQAFLQLYVADADEEGKLSNEERFSKVLNTRYHESTPTFTSDGNTIYFTRNNYNAGVYRQDIDGINKLKIYKSTKKGSLGQRLLSCLLIMMNIQ